MFLNCRVLLWQQQDQMTGCVRWEICVWKVHWPAAEILRQQRFPQPFWCKSSKALCCWTCSEPWPTTDSGQTHKSCHQVQPTSCNPLCRICQMLCELFCACSFGLSWSLLMNWHLMPANYWVLQQRQIMFAGVGHASAVICVTRMIVFLVRSIMRGALCTGRALTFSSDSHQWWCYNQYMMWSCHSLCGALHPQHCSARPHHLVTSIFILSLSDQG